MAKRIAHIVVSSLLSFLLLFGSTTMSFVHSFTDHEDTTDIRSAHNEGPAIESQHHHCAFLGFALAPFANDSERPVILLTRAFYFPEYYSSYHSEKLQEYAEQLLLRGPPVIA